MLRDGFYKVSFSTPQGSGSGLVVFKGTTIQGGDFGYTYKGDIGLTGGGDGGGQLTARLQVKQYEASATSVFGALRDFHLDLVGTFNATSFSARGGTDRMPGVSIEIRGTYVDEAL